MTPSKFRSRRLHGLCFAALSLAIACDKKDPAPATADKKAETKKADTKDAKVAKADAKAATPATTAAAPTAATGTTSATPTAAGGESTGNAEVDAAAKVALEMCKKEMDQIAATDKQTLDKFVAVLPNPTYSNTPDSYLRQGMYAFVGTRAGVRRFKDDGRNEPYSKTVEVIVTSDGTDPCTVDVGKLMTPTGNPAVNIQLTGLMEAGEATAWAPTEMKTQGQLRYGTKVADPKAGQEAATTAGHRSQGYFTLAKVEKGKSLELSVHSCEAQASELTFMGAALPHRYFALGTIQAIFCPNAAQ